MHRPEAIRPDPGNGAGSVSGRRSALHTEAVEAAEVVRVGQLMEPHDEVDVAAWGEREALAHAARLLARGLLEAKDNRVRRSGLDGSGLGGATDRPAGQQGPALIPGPASSAIAVAVQGEGHRAVGQGGCWYCCHHAEQGRRDQAEPCNGSFHRALLPTWPAIWGSRVQMPGRPGRGGESVRQRPATYSSSTGTDRTAVRFT